MGQLLDYEASHNILVAEYTAQHDALHKLVSQLIGLSNIDLLSQILQFRRENDALIMELDSSKKERDTLLMERTRMRENIKRLVQLNKSVSL